MSAREEDARMLAAEAMFSLAAGHRIRPSISGGERGMLSSEYNENDRCPDGVLNENLTNSSNISTLNPLGQRRDIVTHSSHHHSLESEDRSEEDDVKCRTSATLIPDIIAIATLSKSDFSCESEFTKLANSKSLTSENEQVSVIVCNESTIGIDIPLVRRSQQNLMGGCAEMVLNQSASKLSRCGENLNCLCRSTQNRDDNNNNNEVGDLWTQRRMCGPMRHIEQPSVLPFEKFNHNNEKQITQPESFLFNSNVTSATESLMTSATSNILNIHLENKEHLNQIPKQLLNINVPTVVNIFNVISERPLNTADQNTISAQITDKCDVIADAVTCDIDAHRNVETSKACTSLSTDDAKYTVTSVTSFITTPIQLHEIDKLNLSSTPPVQSFVMAKSVEVGGAQNTETLNTVTAATRHEVEKSNSANLTTKCDTEWPMLGMRATELGAERTVEPEAPKSCSLHKATHDTKTSRHSSNSEMNTETRSSDENPTYTTDSNSSAGVEETHETIASPSSIPTSKQSSLEAIQCEIRTSNSFTSYNMELLKSPIVVTSALKKETSELFKVDPTQNGLESSKETSSPLREVDTVTYTTSTLSSIGNDSESTTSSVVYVSCNGLAQGGRSCPETILATVHDGEIASSSIVTSRGDMAKCHVDLPMTTDTPTCTIYVSTAMDTPRVTMDVPTPRSTSKCSPYVTTPSDIAKCSTYVTTPSDIAKCSTYVPTIMSISKRTTSVPNALETSKVATDVPTRLETSKVTTDVPTMLETSKVTTDVITTLETSKVATDVPTMLQASKVATDVPTMLETSKVTKDVPTTLETSKVGSDVPTMLESSKVATDVPTMLETSKVTKYVPTMQEASKVAIYVPTTLETSKVTTDVPKRLKASNMTRNVPSALETSKLAMTVPTPPETSKLAMAVPTPLETSNVAMTVPTTLETSNVTTDLRKILDTSDVTTNATTPTETSKYITYISTSLDPATAITSVSTTWGLAKCAIVASKPLSAAECATSNSTMQLCPPVIQSSSLVLSSASAVSQTSSGILHNHMSSGSNFRQIYNIDNPCDAISTNIDQWTNSGDTDMRSRGEECFSSNQDVKGSKVYDTNCHAIANYVSEEYRVSAGVQTEHVNTDPHVATLCTRNLNTSCINTGVLNDITLNIAQSSEALCSEPEQSYVLPGIHTCQLANSSALMGGGVGGEAEPNRVSRIYDQPTGGVVTVDKCMHVADAPSVQVEIIPTESCSNKSKMMCVDNCCPVSMLPTVVEVVEAEKPLCKTKNKGKNCNKSSNLMDGQAGPKKKRGRPKGSFKKKPETFAQLYPENCVSQELYHNPRNIAPFKYMELPPQHHQSGYSIEGNHLPGVYTSPLRSMGHFQDIHNRPMMNNGKDELASVNGSQIRKHLQYVTHNPLVSQYRNFHDVRIAEENLQKDVNFVFRNNGSLYCNASLPIPCDNSMSFYGRTIHNIPLACCSDRSSESAILPPLHSLAQLSISGQSTRDNNLINQSNANDIALNLTMSRSHQHASIPGQKSPREASLRGIDNQNLTSDDGNLTDSLPKLISVSHPNLQTLSTYSMQESMKRVPLQTSPLSSINSPMSEKRHSCFSNYNPASSPNFASSQSSSSTLSTDTQHAHVNVQQSNTCSKPFLSKHVDLHDSSSSLDSNLASSCVDPDSDSTDRHKLAFMVTRTVTTTAQCRNISDNSVVSSKSFSRVRTMSPPLQQTLPVIDCVSQDSSLPRLNDILHRGVSNSPLLDEVTAETSQSYLPLKKRRMNYMRCSNTASRNFNGAVEKSQPVERSQVVEMSQISVQPSDSPIEVRTSEKTDHHNTGDTGQGLLQIGNDQNISEPNHLPFQANTDHNTRETNDRPFRVKTDHNVDDSAHSPFQVVPDQNFDDHVHIPLQFDPGPNTKGPANRLFQADTNHNNKDKAQRSFQMDIDQSVNDPVERPFQIDPRTSLQCLSEIQLALSPDEDGDVPLHIAVAQENIKAVEHYIKLVKVAGGSVDIVNNDKQTPMHLAVITNQPACVTHLLRAGANIDAPNHAGLSSLHLAAKSGYVDCLKVLTEQSTYPVDLNRKDFEGFTPLHLAVQQKQTESMRMLLKLGADVNAQDGKSGRTPLFHAVEDNYIAAVELLLSHNANVEIHNYSGVTPVIAATGRGHTHLVTNILQYENRFEQSLSPSSPPPLLNCNGETYMDNSPVTDENMRHRNTLPSCATNDAVMNDGCGNMSTERPVFLTTRPRVKKSAADMAKNKTKMKSKRKVSSNKKMYSDHNNNDNNNNSDNTTINNER